MSSAGVEGGKTRKVKKVVKKTTTSGSGTKDITTETTTTTTSSSSSEIRMQNGSTENDGRSGRHLICLNFGAFDKLLAWSRHNGHYFLPSSMHE